MVAHDVVGTADGGSTRESHVSVCVLLYGFIGDESTQVELFFDADVLSQLRCIQNQTAYDVTMSGINAWFEAIWVEPHVSYASAVD